MLRRRLALQHYNKGSKSWAGWKAATLASTFAGALANATEMLQHAHLAGRHVNCERLSVGRSKLHDIRAIVLRPVDHNAVLAAGEATLIATSSCPNLPQLRVLRPVHPGLHFEPIGRAARAVRR